MSRSVQSRSVGRAGLLLAASLTATALTATTFAPAATSGPATRATTDNTPVKIAAKWLRGELTGGLVMGPQGPDYGLTLDAGIALDRAGDRAAVSAISAAFQPKIADYIGTDKEIYGGPTAKAAVFARIARGNPTSYAGVNLITRLEGQIEDPGKVPPTTPPTPTTTPSPTETTSPSPSPTDTPSPTASPTTTPTPVQPATPGRLSDTSQYGDFANVVGQSYAVNALSLASSAETGHALSFLLQQQCASGAFRLSFSKPGDAAQGCVDGAPGSEADADVTALAVINLIASHERGQPVQTALAKAGAWLAAQQRPNGAFRGVGSTRKANTNSTGLAGHALGLLNNRAAASKAAVWVRKRQPVDKWKCRTALSKELGAVAYRQPAVRPARTAGITADARGEWQRATTQAIAVLQYAPTSPDKLNIHTNRRKARSGDKVRYWIRGIAPGERACVQIKGNFKRAIGKASGGKIVRGLRMPSGNHGRWAIVKTADDKDTKWIRVRN